MLLVNRTACRLVKSVKCRMNCVRSDFYRLTVESDRRVSMTWNGLAPARLFDTDIAMIGGWTGRLTGLTRLSPHGPGRNAVASSYRCFDLLLGDSLWSNEEGVFACYGLCWYSLGEHCTDQNIDWEYRSMRISASKAKSVARNKDKNSVSLTAGFLF